MDTISRESNSSYLPVAAIIVGVIAIVLSVVALAKGSGVDQKIADAQAGQADRLAAMENEVRTAALAAEGASKTVTALQRATNEAFGNVSQAMGTLRDDIAKVQELATKPAPAATRTASGASATPAVAGPDEYVVKGGDTGVKIAAANGVSLADLLAVNPGVNWSRLAVGQKLKLPKK